MAKVPTSAAGRNRLLVLRGIIVSMQRNCASHALKVYLSGDDGLHTVVQHAPGTPMNILAFAASNHRMSINRDLVGFAAERFRNVCPDAAFEFVDLNDFEMPIYSIDREDAEGVHPLAKVFFQKVGECDAVIVSFAEYNGFVTSAWKNIYDWMSRINMRVWQDKPVVLLAATPGPSAGANVLKTQVETPYYFGMDVKGVCGVGMWAEAWDGTKLIKEDDVANVDAAVKRLLI